MVGGKGYTLKFGSTMILNLFELFQNSALWNRSRMSSALTSRTGNVWSLLVRKHFVILIKK